jgi:hypothetical protein
MHRKRYDVFQEFFDLAFDEVGIGCDPKLSHPDVLAEYLVGRLDVRFKLIEVGRYAALIEGIKQQP